MQIGIQSLLASVPELLNIIGASFFICIVWSVLGIQLYQSKFRCVPLQLHCFFTVGDCKGTALP